MSLPTPKSDATVLIDAAAAQLGVSRRTVYYRLCLENPHCTRIVPPAQ